MREFKKATEEVKQSFEAETKDLEEFKTDLTGDNITSFIEEASASTEAVSETAPPTEVPVPEQPARLEEATPPLAEGKSEAVKKEEQEGEGNKEGTLARG